MCFYIKQCTLQPCVIQQLSLQEKTTHSKNRHNLQHSEKTRLHGTHGTQLVHLSHSLFCRVLRGYRRFSGKNWWKKKMVKNAAFQETFQLAEQAKMVALLKIYSHFAIYRHRGRNLVQVQKTLFFFFFLKRMTINLGFPQPQSVISDLICLCNQCSIISAKDTAGNICVHTLNAARATDSAASASRRWMHGLVRVFSANAFSII